MRAGGGWRAGRHLGQQRFDLVPHIISRTYLGWVYTLRVYMFCNNVNNRPGSLTCVRSPSVCAPVGWQHLHLAFCPTC